MIKYTKVIVDQHRNLTGFIADVSGQKFFTNKGETETRPFSINDIISNKMSNSQIKVENGKISAKSGFSINSLPMVVYTSNGFVDIENSMELTARYVQNNENIGFRVKFGDNSEDNIKYENIINMSNWFKPINFVIRTSESGKKFIAGKPGVQLDKLQSIVLGEEPKAKRTRSAAKNIPSNIVTNLENGYDILDLYDFIGTNNGCVINFPTEKYEQTGAKTENGEFNSYGVGEVAPAFPSFAYGKLNVNARFKKVGYIDVVVQGVKQRITTYVFRTKNIFYNAENHIKKFGIAIPKDKADDLISKLGASLSITEITDVNIITPLSQVIDSPSSLRFFTVDTSKLDLVSKDKRDKSKLSHDQLYATCMSRFKANVLTKYTAYKMGELKKQYGDSIIEKAIGTEIFTPFRMYNEATLTAIAEAGINIYSGAYNTPYTHTAQAFKGDATISVEYNIQGYDASKITGSKIEQLAIENDTDKLPDDIIKLVNSLTNIANPTEQYAKLYKVNKTAQHELDTANRTLWVHTASMYIEGDKKYVHSHDSKLWAPAQTRVKKAEVYESTTVKGLIVKITGIALK